MTATEAVHHARSALRYLAERRLPPTPDQYNLAWRAVGGSRSTPTPSASASTSTNSATTPATVQRMLCEVTDLLMTVCETVPVLVEEEAWVRQQFDALRAALHPCGEPMDTQALVQANALLRGASEEHQRRLMQRRDSLQTMKAMIAQCVGWLSTLTESSNQFSSKLEVYIDEIQCASDLPTLTGTVRHLIDDTRAMYGVLDGSKHDFTAAGIHAQELQQEISRLARELSSTSQQVMSDHLTKLLNRRGLERTFEELTSRCRSEGRRLSLALLDVDDFKKLNDAFGHQVGDAALQHLATLLAGKVRPGDLTARYGGEEFVILMPDVDGHAGGQVVRRIQRALSVDGFRHESEQIFMTFSAGIADVHADDTLSAVVARADSAMYAAKRDGKNGVHIATPGDAEESCPAGDRSFNTV